jgi:hypothetical protein
MHKRNKVIDAAIGNRVRAIRVSSSRAIEDLAAAADMAVEDCRRSEQGKRRFTAAELFAVGRALGVWLADIVSGLEYPT